MSTLKRLGKKLDEKYPRLINGMGRLWPLLKQWSRNRFLAATCVGNVSCTRRV